LQDRLLDAAEVVLVRQGIASLTLDAVATEAHISKGGLLYHFPSKDRLVEALVRRSAEAWRACYMDAYRRTPEGPGRMARALLRHCLSDAQGWTDQLQHSSSAVFAALAQNPSLIKPMRAVYGDLHRRIDEDGLPFGVGQAVAAAVDGLWLSWVLGLARMDQDLMARVRLARSGTRSQQGTRHESARVDRVPARVGRGHRRRSCRVEVRVDARSRRGVGQPARAPSDPTGMSFLSNTGRRAPCGPRRVKHEAREEVT
jgi:AcrR family transcriptional regulator